MNTLSLLSANGTRATRDPDHAAVWPVAASAQLKVLISGGFSGAYEQLLPGFKQTSGIAANRIGAGTDVDLARVAVGVAVRVGAPKPNVSTVGLFKKVLLQAKTVSVPGSTSGIWVTTVLFPRLGLAEKISVKVTPRGNGAAALVASGDADIAVLPVSEILYAPGVDLAGAIAPEIQFIQTFAAAVVAGSTKIQEARRLIEFLSSERASEAIRNSGMEPLATAR